MLAKMATRSFQGLAPTASAKPLKGCFSLPVAPSKPLASRGGCHWHVLPCWTLEGGTPQLSSFPGFGKVLGFSLFKCQHCLNTTEKHRLPPRYCLFLLWCLLFFLVPSLCLSLPLCLSLSLSVCLFPTPSLPALTSLGLGCCWMLESQRCMEHCLRP